MEYFKIMLKRHVEEEDNLSKNQRHYLCVVSYNPPSRLIRVVTQDFTLL